MKDYLYLVLCLFIGSCASNFHANKLSYVQEERNKWLNAANEGNAEAQFQLGNAWCCGEGGFFSTQKAITWWKKAAAQGHKQAQNKLKMIKK